MALITSSSDRLDAKSGALQTAPGPSSTALVPGLDYNAYQSRAAEVRQFYQSAYQSEADAAAMVGGVQRDLATLLTDPQLRDRADLQHAKQLELEACEARWQSAALLTAELRNELRELAKQRDGDYTDEFKFSGLHSLDRCKPTIIRSEDISPQRKRLVREAFPEVNPAYGVNVADPAVRLTPDAIRTTFESLDREQSGYLTIAAVIHYLAAKGDFGIPNFAESFVFKTLKSLKSPPKEGEKITLEQFRCLVLRWAAL